MKIHTLYSIPLAEAGQTARVVALPENQNNPNGPQTLYRLVTPKVYRVRLTQAGTAAPVVLFEYENSIGPIVWTRSSAGLYVGTLTGAFPNGKVFSAATLVAADSTFLACPHFTANTIGLHTHDGSALADDLINEPAGCLFECIVYP